MVESGTWGMIFFSFWSWNRGVAGRSSARNRNGDERVVMSVNISTRVQASVDLMLTSSRLKHRSRVFLVCDDLLRLDLYFALECGIYDTRVPLFRSSQIPV